MGGGVFRGSSVMVSGTAGTGKSSISAAYADAACRRGEPALYISLEESPEQIIRNMRSIGYDLRQWVDAGLLRIEAIRPTAFGFEEHLAMLHQLVDDFEPRLVVLDALAGLARIGSGRGTSHAIARDIDLLKGRNITAVMTILSHGNEAETTEVDMSSLVDTWLLVRNHEDNGERNRLIFVIKSRGTAHSNQVREFVLTDSGPELIKVYVGEHGVVTGSARVAQLEREQRDTDANALEAERRRATLVQRAASIQAQITDLQAQLATENADFEAFMNAEGNGLSREAAERAAHAERLSGLGGQTDPQQSANGGDA